MSHSPEQFVGAWSLVEWRIEYPGGRVTHPFGQDAVGQLLYTADGRMSATVSAARRPAFGIANVRDAADSPKADAFVSYFHYAGEWRVEGDSVVHSVEFALTPDMVGTEQRRQAQFAGTSLRLSAEEGNDDDRSRRHVLEWRRSVAPAKKRNGA